MPEHCQMYPLPFDRMSGAKHLVFMIWTVYKIVMKFRVWVVLIVLIKNALPEYQQVCLHGNGSSRIFYAGRVKLPGQMMIMDC